MFSSTRPLILWTATLLAAALVLSCSEPPPPTPSGEAYLGEGAVSDELPVTRVALYQNGVGYFERRGEVVGDIITLRARHTPHTSDVAKPPVATIMRAAQTVTWWTTSTTVAFTPRVLTTIPAQRFESTCPWFRRVDRTFIQRRGVVHTEV